MISKTESGRVSKEILGSGSGSGTRWALAVDDTIEVVFTYLLARLCYFRRG